MAVRRTLARSLLVRGSATISVPMPGMSRVVAASTMASQVSAMIWLPVASAATLCSSTTFHWMNSSTSGWSAFRITILAARREVPPDLMAPPAASPTFRNDMRPLEIPPPESFSLRPRTLEKLVPEPEPNLNSRASRTHRSMIPPGPTRSSLMLWMKQAEVWGWE